MQYTSSNYIVLHLHSIQACEHDKDIKIFHDNRSDTLLHTIYLVT